MARVIKRPEERRSELLEAAEKLFREKGYANTVVSDIVKESGVAQGTFYVYFKSKEDIFLAILEEIREGIINEIESVQKDKHLNALQKLNSVIALEFKLNRRHDTLFVQLHHTENVSIHQKYIISTINRLVPIYTAIVEQGIQENIFNTRYPKAVSEYHLVATKFLFDPALFPLSKDEYVMRIEAAQDISEKALGLREGSIILPDIRQLLESGPE